MIQFELTPRFVKRYAKLSAKLKAKAKSRLALFVDDPNLPILRVHPLRGNLVGLRALSVSGDCRIVFKYLTKEKVLLIDIGSHNQVY